MTDAADDAERLDRKRKLGNARANRHREKHKIGTVPIDADGRADLEAVRLPGETQQAAVARALRKLRFG